MAVKYGKDGACGSVWEICSWTDRRHTHRHAHCNTSPPLPRAK